MRKWLTLLILGLVLAFPSLAAAQDEIRLASLDVKLWPEYDQPSMLVIYDFQVTRDVSLPTRVSFRIPRDASVNAVAALENGEFVNSGFDGPKPEGQWQVLSVIVDAPTAYRFEYYQPLSVAEKTRQFSYQWAGEYAVDAFTVSVQQPLDTTGLTTDPVFTPRQETDGLTYYNSPVISLKAGEQFKLKLQYKKTSDKLTVPSPNIEPAAPLNENTSGRVSLNNYVPYIVGALGVIFVVGGIGYYFLWGRPRPAERRQHRRSRAQRAGETGNDIYCPQCGQRARPGDRFCRVCGTRLRQPEG
jgi:hypothetical protein